MKNSSVRIPVILMILFCFARLVHAESPGETGKEPAAAETAAGFYDYEAVYGRDPDINLILTPKGHGRLINRTSSVNFDFTVENGQIVPSSPELSLTVTGEDEVTVEISGMSLVFRRRPPVTDGEVLTGSWEAVGLRGRGTVMDETMLRLSGIRIYFTAYPSGAIDWYALTDSESELAQGWGRDGEGLYVKNGDSTMRCTVDGNLLTMTMNTRGITAEYDFRRAEAQETAGPADEPGQAEEAGPEEIWRYTEMDDGSAKITGLKKNVTVLDIPSEIGGLPVTKIGEDAFKGTEIEAAHIPEGVTEIEAGAFSRCVNMTELTLPDSLTVIGAYAFNSCTGITELTLPQNLGFLDNGAFRSMNGLTAVTLPEGIRYMSEVFAECLNLETVYLPDDMIRLPDKIFMNCSSLREIHFGSQIQIIGYEAFFSCRSLTEVILPDTVTTIEDQAFYDCESLTGLTLPAGVTSVSDSAFDKTPGMHLIVAEGSYGEEYARTKGLPYETFEAELPGQEETDTETEFVSGSFRFRLLPDGTCKITGYQGDETELEVPPLLEGHPVTVIAGQAFLGCDAEKILLPGTLKEIEGHAFDLASVREIGIEEGPSVIGDYAFYLCGSLESINIPFSVREIGINPFFGCVSLKRLDLQTAVQFFRFINGYLYDMSEKRLICLLPAEGQETCRVGSDDCEVQIIDAGAFAFSGLKQVILPDTVQEIRNSAFRGCRDLETVTIPDSVTEIGEDAFLDTENVTLIAGEGSRAWQFAQENNLPCMPENHEKDQ